jgi:hypothetical protein
LRLLELFGGDGLMGRQTGDQSQLFYLFKLERRIPACHLLRQINPVVTRLIAPLNGGHPMLD